MGIGAIITTILTIVAEAGLSVAIEGLLNELVVAIGGESSAAAKAEIENYKKHLAEIRKQMDAVNETKVQMVQSEKNITNAFAKELDLHDKTIAFNKTQEGQIKKITDAELTRHEQNATFNNKQIGQMDDLVSAQLELYQQNATFNDNQLGQMDDLVSAQLELYQQNATLNDQQKDQLTLLMDERLQLHDQTETFNNQEADQISALVLQQLDAHQQILDAKAAEKAATDAIRDAEAQAAAEAEARAQAEAEALEQTEQEWSDVFQGLINGTTTWDDLWQQACDKALDTLIDMLMQAALESETFKDLFEGLGDMFGIGSDDTESGESGDFWTDVITIGWDLIKGIFGFQHGGIVPSGPLLASRGMVVPNLKNFGTDRVLSALTPNEMVLPVHLSEGLQNMIQNGGGATNVTNNYINAIDTQSFQQALAKNENRGIIRMHNALNKKQTGQIW